MSQTGIPVSVNVFDTVTSVRHQPRAATPRRAVAQIVDVREVEARASYSVGS